MFLFNTGYIIFTKDFCISCAMHLPELQYIYQKITPAYLKDWYMLCQSLFSLPVT